MLPTHISGSYIYPMIDLAESTCLGIGITEITQMCVDTHVFL